MQTCSALPRARVPRLRPSTRGAASPFRPRRQQASSFSLSDRRVLLDARGSPCAGLKRAHVALKPTWGVYRDANFAAQVATVKVNFSMAPCELPAVLCSDVASIATGGTLRACFLPCACGAWPCCASRPSAPTTQPCVPAASAGEPLSRRPSLWQLLNPELTFVPPPPTPAVSVYLNDGDSESDFKARRAPRVRALALGRAAERLRPCRVAAAAPPRAAKRCPLTLLPALSDPAPPPLDPRQLPRQGVCHLPEAAGRPRARGRARQEGVKVSWRRGGAAGVDRV